MIALTPQPDKRFGLAVADAFGMVDVRLMPKSPPSASPPAELSFEQAMARLDELVGNLEQQQLPLENMVSSYEEGMQLLKLCRQRIETARQRVERINSLLDAGGEPTLEPFEPAAEEPAAPRPAKKAPAPPADDDEDIRLF